MLRIRQLLLTVAMIAAFATTVGGCAPRGARDGGAIHLNLGAEPPTLDPALAADPASTQVDELLFLGLTDLDDETMEAGPELATRWEVSPDGLVWTFYLRDDVYWVHYDPAARRLAKKRPVTAADVEYAVKRALDPATGSPYAYLLFIIKNGEAFHAGSTTNANEVGVRAVADDRVEFTLERPVAHFPIIAGMRVARPTPREVIDQHGYKWGEPGNIWTNGPYALETWTHESRMTMVKNSASPDAERVSIQRIDWAMMDDGPEVLAEYEAGNLDVCAIAPGDLDAVKADPRLSSELRVVPQLSTYYLGFNNSKPPFDNRLVRQAFSYALDRGRLVDTVLKAGQQPARTFAAPGVFGSPAVDPDFAGVEFDAQRAKALLAEAGFPGGEGLPEILLVYPTGGLHQQVAEFAQTSWRQVLGVEVSLAGQEIGDYIRALAEDAPQVFSSVWTADFPDEDNWVFQNFHSGQGVNSVRWYNAEFDRLVEQARVTGNMAERQALYAQAERLLCVEEAAIAPLFHPARALCTKPSITRTYSPLGDEHIDRWTIGPR